MIMAEDKKPKGQERPSSTGKIGESKAHQEKLRKGSEIPPKTKPKDSK